MSKCAKEKVVGARRVWGSMSICTASVVKGAIERFCGISTVHVRSQRFYTLVVCYMMTKMFFAHLKLDGACLRYKQPGN